MNTDQVDIVLNYLATETSHALVICGDYGVGKTYFFKNVLVPKIKETAVSRKNETKKFTPIHISLFGYKSLEDIQLAIFLELVPILKNKSLATGIVKSIARGMTSVLLRADIDKFIGDIVSNSENAVNYDEIVICFDDLDRKSNALDLNDVFGFINSLVESQRAKILIIVNEDQLLLDVKYSSSLREKVVGITIQYKPNPRTVYKTIVEQRYSGSNRIYVDFLEGNIDVILDFVGKCKNNFRNMIFFMEQFLQIFSVLEKRFQEDHALKAYRNDMLDAVLRYTLAISIEYKTGELNSTNMEAVRGMDDPNTSRIDYSLFLLNKFREDASEKEPSYVDQFAKKYFSGSKFYAFFSIFDFITGHKALQEEELLDELRKSFISSATEMSPYEILIQNVRFPNAFSYNMHEYRKYISEAFKIVDSGMFKIHEYPMVFQLATMFNNILRFNLSKLRTRFLKGIKKGIGKYEYQKSFDPYFFLGNKKDISIELDDICKYCLKVNKELKDSKENQESALLLRLMGTDFENFMIRVKDSESFRPFWKIHDTKLVFKMITSLSNAQKWGLGNYFSNRYGDGIDRDLFVEREFVFKLGELVGKRTQKRAARNMTNLCLDHLENCLRDSLTKFDDYERLENPEMMN
jgi:hypothetical protein